MFLRQYTNIQLGMVSPDIFRRAEETRKVFTLDYDRECQLPEDALRVSSTAMAVDPTDRFLLTGYKDGSWSIVDCWTTTSESSFSQFKLVKTSSIANKHKFVISSAFWFSDNGSFSTCSLDGSLNIYDTNNPDVPLCSFGSSETEFHYYKKHSVNPLNPLMIAASCTEEKQVFFIDLRIGSEIQSLPALPSHQASVNCMTWCPASEHKITLGTVGGHLIEWDLRSTREYLQGYCNTNILSSGPGGRPGPGALPMAHRQEISSIKYSDDGNEIFSYGADGLLHKFCTNSCSLEESVHIRDRDSNNNNHWPTVSIHVFEHLEIPVIVVPKCTSINIVNMSTGLGLIVSKRKCHWIVNGFTYNRTLLKGFTYGVTAKVFSANQHSNEQEDQEKPVASTGLIDLTGL